jgi:hypothetical protein
MCGCALYPVASGNKLIICQLGTSCVIYIINNLLFIFQKDDSLGKAGEKTALEKVVEPLTVPDKGPAKQPINKVEKKPEKVTATVVQQEQAAPPPPSKERNKKKKSELATLQQMSEYIF